MAANRGRIAHLSGLAAEDQVVRLYQSQGLTLVDKRWRGACGEIDLVFQNGAQLIFVEVKKSRSMDAAALKISRRQIDRIMAAGTEYVAHQGFSQSVDMRFDAALVDQMGAISILEGALSEF
ncbi:MAG: YraN family protein [Thalassovita sp.]